EDITLSKQNYRIISINNYRREVPEFLMELDIQLEEEPVIQRLYSYSRSLNITKVYHDNKFIYLFDTFTKTLFIVKQSATYSASSLIYKIDLSKNFQKTEGSKISLLFVPFIYKNKNSLNIILNNPDETS